MMIMSLNGKSLIVKSELMVRFITDCKDARQDKFIPLEEAKRLYDEGEIAYDMTNKAYCKK